MLNKRISKMILSTVIALMVINHAGAEIVSEAIAYNSNSYIDGVRYEFFITKKIAENEPDWSPASGSNPPLAIWSAVTLGSEWLNKKKEIIPEGTVWRVSAVELVPIHEVLYSKKWMWRVVFSRENKSSAPHSGPGTIMRVPILMSGEITENSQKEGAQ